jgi:catechol 2,3-dioxygenase-like lactoylglutathione lyase family enzyme
VVLESDDIIAFVSTTDLARARRFHERTLGLRFIEQSEVACVIDANGTMLRITAVPEVAHAGYTVLGWTVADIELAVRRLADNGVQCTR